MKVVIIGGVAAGAGTAARLRRLDESAEIILLERGKTISYANCGLPYHLGGIIPERDSLLIMPAQKFTSWFNVTVRTEHEVLAIDRAAKTVEVRSPGGVYTESYDKLVIATGASPAGERFSETNHPRVAHLWTLADMDRVMAKLPGAGRIAVVGGGFIGLEVAESLRHRGCEVTLIQREAQVLPILDAEMVRPLTAELIRLGIDLQCNCTVERFEDLPSGVRLHLSSGTAPEYDLAIVATGVVPNSALAQACGLACGPRGHITVNEQLQTSDPAIYAAGDVVEVLDPILKGKTAIPLAGPANKQGRIVATNLAGGSAVYRGSLGASIVKVGGLSAAAVGLTERRLQATQLPYHKLYLHPGSHAGYYPGATQLSIKVLFAPDGQIYGAQIVGRETVDKRLDAIAHAMRFEIKIQELGELESAYAPPYNSAKDPVNFAGFIAENILSGLSDTVFPDTIPEGAVILDTREPGEHAAGAIPGAINIPLGTLRSKLGTLDREKFYVVHCQVGLRGYLAERILKQAGFRCANLSGGWKTWKLFNP